jgi:ACS family hexuronate transporter-like MFS transporter
MLDANPAPLPSLRRPAWKWWVCGLLLLATMLNYMDRLTLNQMAERIMQAFTLDEEEYGLLETAFSVAFALGALTLGCAADRWNVWWVYPLAVLTWSLAGFATGFVESYVALLGCRFLLGFTEAGHWPCALRTTQRITPPSQRTLGNSILQSGAAIGAIITPLVVWALLRWTGTWRYPFMVVGGLGLFWVFLWLTLVRRHDLTPQGRGEVAVRATDVDSGWQAVGAILRERRFWVLVVVVWSINITWHFFRAWMPLFLRKYHGYDEEDTQLFTSAYYLATDAGSFAAGFATLWLTRRGAPVHGSRVAVFALCTLLTTLSVVAAGLDAGPLLLVLLLVIGFGALGLFPNYYSFSQELSVRHQGKVTGLLGCINWLMVGLFQWLVGRSIKETESYDLGLTLAGLTPLVGLAVLVFFWGPSREPRRQEAIPEAATPREDEVHAPADERIQADVRGIRKL